jgi:predicted glycogen debranching enzyme
MDEPRRDLSLDQNLRQCEWLVANGLGGYASGIVAGEPTRRYHGLLIAALPSPLGRLVMLNHLVERFDGMEPKLIGFRLEWQLPVWRFEIPGAVIEKRIVVPHRQNIVHLTYRVVDGNRTVSIELEPLIHFRPIEAAVDLGVASPYVVSVIEQRVEISGGPELPPLRLRISGDATRLTLKGGRYADIAYSREAERGYDSRGPLWSPGVFAGEAAPGRDLALIAATDPWGAIDAVSPGEARRWEEERRRRLVAQAPPALREGVGAELVLAADAFIFTPVGRQADVARAHAFGDEVRSIIAGYHWFTDWGRDTMISLEGLTLATGRENEAGWILRTYAHYVRDGLIPNMFPEGRNSGLYHTADATLWFFHALDRYLAATRDRATLRQLLPVLREIIDRHLGGTRFGIGVDPSDGLLRQGAEGYQLTWMDAKVDDWVVTPRRGKAVEINALWFNALSLMASWLAEEGDGRGSHEMAGLAARVRGSFNSRFWCEERGYLYDVVDGEHGDDDACRPNQVLAISLPNAVLERSRWEAVMETIRRDLLTPVGLRSLAPGHPDFKGKYFGNLRSRDAAYHQGTVWAWLIGPFIDAWLKLNPEDRSGARRLLDGFAPHLGAAGIGTISEIFDAEAPFSPRGCIAQAWSVAEVIRCWLSTAPGGSEKTRSPDVLPTA